MIELVLKVLGCLNLSSIPFLSFLVLAEKQRMRDLLLRIRLSACKTLPCIRCSSANVDGFHPSEHDERLIRIPSWYPFWSMFWLGSVLAGHDERLIRIPSWYPFWSMFWLGSVLAGPQIDGDRHTSSPFLDREVGDRQDIASLSVQYPFCICGNWTSTANHNRQVLSILHTIGH